MGKGQENEDSQAGDAEADEKGNSSETVREGIVLNKPYLAVTPLAVYLLKNGAKLVISKGSVVEFSGDAIVNAANRGGLIGGGVDGAIARAGGEELAKAREALPTMEDGSRIKEGGAVITVGGSLNARYCIHAVGPDYMMLDDKDKGNQLLYSAYKEAMTRAKEKELKTIAFSLISAGIYRGDCSLDHVLSIGLKSIAANTYDGLDEVHLVGFTMKEIKALLKSSRHIFAESSVSSDGQKPANTK
mmetsp:Transcript_13339/g.15245  ORF Transcript_13339/g.15245 Transcript_13339/m.15245 type:complete len:245 (+) Transcript_13339:311-1045(+)|eukprot:CAMPEP_0184073476 /NCGR_PEP_ID=MMETSP0957-20130417/64570_1 /TAXON_ID=627963 /ORGANISM="Aplanochytrium sp, Strain PBS07" /LENGTH=244 /DNA_ID=CAMNT_0026375141 /DNA_START=69 /DNA_END=803 /DNA_ORIENTATION=-